MSSVPSLPDKSAIPPTEPLSKDAVQALPSRPARRIAIVVYYSDGAEMALLVPDVPLLVGRNPSTGLRVPETTLSREHARFLLSDGRIIVEDLRSTNGTRIGGELIKSAEIMPGDELMLGNVRARVHALDPSEDELNLRGGKGGELAGGEAIFADPAMREILDTVNRVASSRVPVILHGETGTGKEVLARLIHEGGARRGKPMVRVNCGAIPAHLVESTLFGHERGAFTGAVQQQKGVFEEADGGTVFLDEIGELPLPAQAALLRVLETGAFSRVGSSREITVDVRVIAATHCDLVAMSKKGHFRTDLYYRLNTVTIEIPPLRKRKESLKPLIARFLQQASESNGRPVRTIEPSALALLESYDWPGNVRELKNVIERAVVLALSERIRPQDLPAQVRAARAKAGKQASAPGDVSEGRPTRPIPGPESGELRTRVQQYESEAILRALEATKWDRKAAARQLGLPIRTLTHKLKVLGIKRPGRATS